MKQRLSVWLVLAGALLLQWMWWQDTWVKTLPGYVPSTGPLQYDYSVLTYQIQMAREFFAAKGVLHGPDVWINMGYPLTFIWNSNVWLQTVAVALPSWSIGEVLKLGYWLAVMGMPVAWWGALRLCEGEEERPPLWLGVWVLAGMAVFRTGMGSLFLWAGMETAALFIPVCVLVTALFQRALEKGKAGDWFHLVMAVALGAWVHKTMVVVAGCLWLGALVAGPGRGKLLLWAAVTVLVTGLINSFWILPMLQVWEFKTLRPDAPFWVEGPARFLTDHFTGTKTYLTGELHGLWGATLLYLAAFTAGVAGAMMGWRDERQRALILAWAAMGGFVVFGGWQGFGSMTELGATLNHYRFLLNWQMLGLWVLWRAWRSPPVLPAWAPAAVMPMLVLFSMLPGYQSFFGIKPIVEGVPKDLPVLVRALQKEASGGGGLLLEDSGGWDGVGVSEKYFGTYLTGQIPFLVRRQQLGGPYPYVFLSSHKLSPLAGKWLGIDVRAMKARDAAWWLRKNDIRTSLVWSNAMRNLLLEADCSERGRGGAFSLLRCDAVPGTPVLRLPGTMVFPMIKGMAEFPVPYEWRTFPYLREHPKTAVLKPEGVAGAPDGEKGGFHFRSFEDALANESFDAPDFFVLD